MSETKTRILVTSKKEELFDKVDGDAFLKKLEQNLKNPKAKDSPLLHNSLCSCKACSGSI
jgi:hypothetical protein